MHVCVFVAIRCFNRYQSFCIHWSCSLYFRVWGFSLSLVSKVATVTGAWYCCTEQAHESKGCLVRVGCPASSYHRMKMEVGGLWLQMPCFFLHARWRVSHTPRVISQVCACSVMHLHMQWKTQAFLEKRVTCAAS